MCIIIVIPKNRKIPGEDVIRQCFVNNPDGAGIMYCSGGNVIIRKGLMTIDSLLEVLSDTDCPADSPMIIHFRIGTSGKRKSDTCTHPFPITHDYREMYKLQNICQIAIAHNGIIGNYADSKSNLSDTMFFTKLLSGLPNDAAIKRALRGHSASNRFVVLRGNGTMIMVGSWEKEKGRYYSNDSYKPRKVFTSNIYDGLDMSGYGLYRFDSSGTTTKTDDHTTDPGAISRAAERDSFESYLKCGESYHLRAIAGKNRNVWVRDGRVAHDDM